MKFSICIPNYNYEKYLGETINSVILQHHVDMEILVADNCSTDRSIEIVTEYQKQYPFIHLKRNNVNLGFAGNLDSVADMATGDFMIMLSSDDLMKPTAIDYYSRLLAALGDKKNCIITAAKDIIDSQSKVLRTELAKDMPSQCWREEDLNPILSQQLGVRVYKVAADEMLKRVISQFANPFNFLATAYPRHLCDAVGGYTRARMINPDKWFHWRLLEVVDDVIFIDEPLFQYRWHASNQTAQEIGSGHLKYVTDEYRTVMEITDGMLRKACLSRSKLHESFVNNIIYKHGMGELSRKLMLKAFRVYCFGWASFPKLMVKSFKTYAFWVLLCLGPIGSVLLRLKKK